MPRIQGSVEVRCSPEHAWDLFTRFDDLARLIPSVEGVEVQGDRVLARVAVKLGALPISSRVVLEVTERKPMACLKAIGISYLGETVVEQLAKKPLREIDAESSGRLDLHLDLRPGEREGSVAVIYEASVEAEGRLRRIYDSILKTKAPAMMQEFAENVRKALEAKADSVVKVALTEAQEAKAPVEVASGSVADLAPAQRRGFFADLWAAVTAFFWRLWRQ